MDTFEKLYKKLQEIRNPFKVIYGMVWATDRQSLASADQEPEEEDLLNEDPLLVLFEYARLQNFRLVDMFKQLDTDNSGSLDRQEFSRGLAVRKYEFYKENCCSHCICFKIYFRFNIINCQLF